MIMQSGFTFWNFLVDVFVIFLFIMWIWLLISVFSDLFRRRDLSGMSKVIWMIFLIILPYLGVFAYLLTQGDGMRDRDAEIVNAARDQFRTSMGFSAADEIVKLEKLKADGVITVEEFGKLRAKLV